MLEDAIDAYLESVDERGFDEPLLALLRSQDFTDVHLVHGNAEFGKDVIAKRDGEQWAFQSKAGDIAYGAWRGLTGQLDELRRNPLSHPSFDTSVPRRCVLVCTGRLTGNAPVAAQQYDEYAGGRDEPGLEVWDRDTLRDMLLNAPTAAFRGPAGGRLLAISGAIETGDVDMDRIEQFSRPWTEWNHQQLASTGVLEASVVAQALVDARRLDLACHVALALVRAAWAAGDRSPEAPVVADAAGATFETYARSLFELRREGLLEPHGLLLTTEPFANWVTYPVRAARTAELLGLLALRLREHEDPLAGEVSDALNTLVSNHPGCSRPLGDRYATSLIPVALALHERHRETAERFLRQAAGWLGERYEPDELGLAADDADPDEEVTRVFGSAFEYVALSRRPESYLACVITDLAAVLWFEELYNDIRHDVLAVDAVPMMVAADDEPAQYLRTGPGVHRVLPVSYTDEWPAGGSLVAGHHADGPDTFELGRRRRFWDQLAVQAVLRDRHRVVALRPDLAGPRPR